MQKPPCDISDCSFKMYAGMSSLFSAILFLNSFSSLHSFWILSVPQLCSNSHDCITQTRLKVRLLNEYNRTISWSQRHKNSILAFNSLLRFQRIYYIFTETKFWFCLHIIIASWKHIFLLTSYIVSTHWNFFSESRCFSTKVDCM